MKFEDYRLDWSLAPLENIPDSPKLQPIRVGKRKKSSFAYNPSVVVLNLWGILPGAYFRVMVTGEYCPGGY